MSLIPPLGFIGAGKVAKVIAKGFLSAGIIKANDIFASSITETDLDHFRSMGCHATNDNKLVVKESKFVFLAMRANVYPDVLKDIFPAVTRNHLIASLASGVTLDYLQNSVPNETRIVRIMLNSAVQYREGIIAAAYGKFARNNDIAFLRLGYFTDVKEDLLPLMTALMTAGYMYVVIDALADGAVRAGLNRDEAVKLVAQTAAGTAKTVTQSGKRLGELKDSVCSAGDSTISGINALEKCGLRGTLMSAIHAATERAKELQKEGTW